jgi:hypothetical protein
MRSSKPRNVLGGSSNARKHPSFTWLSIDCSSVISYSFDSTFVLVFCVCKIVCFRCSREYWVFGLYLDALEGRLDDKECDALALANLHVWLLLFVDDLTLMSESKVGL